MKNLKLKDRIQRFLETLKPMTWRQRIEHIFSYYEEIVLVAVIIFAIVFVIGMVGTDHKEIVLGGSFANVDINQIGYDYLSDDLMELLGADPETQCIELTSTAFEEVTEVSKLDAAYNAAMKPIAQITDGTLDYIVMDELAMQFYMSQYALIDLTDVFSDSEIAEMEDMLIYVYLEEEDIRYPVAFDVTDMPFFKDCVDVTNKVFFGFTGSTENKELYRQFWDYLNAWESAD